MLVFKSLYNSTYLYGFVHSSHFVLHHSCCCLVTGCHVPTVLSLHKEDWFQGEQNLYVGRFKWALVGVAYWLRWADWVLSSMCVGVMVSSVNLERNDWERVCVCVCVCVCVPFPTHLFIPRMKCKSVKLDNATICNQLLHLCIEAALSRWLLLRDTH